MIAYSNTIWLIQNFAFIFLADDKEESITEVHHDQMQPTIVNGYQAPGSYVRPINYGDMEKEQFDELIDRSSECEQYISYRCYNSRLLQDAGG